MLDKIRPNVIIMGVATLIATLLMNAMYGVDGMKEVNLVVFGGLIGVLSTIASDPPPPTVPAGVHADLMAQLIGRGMASL